MTKKRSEVPSKKAGKEKPDEAQRKNNSPGRQKKDARSLLLDHRYSFRLKTGPLLMDDALSFKLVGEDGNPLLMDNARSFRLVREKAPVAKEALQALTDHDNEKLLSEYRAAKQAGDAPGCNAVEWKLVLANEKLIYHVAGKLFAKHRCRECGMEIEDLKSAGYDGLRYAVEKYDPGRGASFGTYAYRQVFSRVLRYVQDNDQAIPIPYWQQLKIRAVRKAKELLRRRGIEPTVQSIAEYLRWDESEVAELQTTPRPDRTVDASVDGSADPRESFDPRADRAAAEPEAHLEAEMQAGEIRRWIQSVLDAQEYRVLNLRYGLEGKSHEPRTLQQVGDELSLSRERIRQVEERALKKLKQFYELFGEASDSPERILEVIEQTNTRRRLMDGRYSFRLVHRDGRPVLLDNRLSFSVVRSGRQALRRLREQVKKQFLENTADENVDMLGALSDDERRVIELRCGLGGRKEKTLREIAAETGLKPVRVWRLEERALKKLEGFVARSANTD